MTDNQVSSFLQKVTDACIHEEDLLMEQQFMNKLYQQIAKQLNITTNQIKCGFKVT